MVNGCKNCGNSYYWSQATTLLIRRSMNSLYILYGTPSKFYPSPRTWRHYASWPLPLPGTFNTHPWGVTTSWHFKPPHNIQNRGVHEHPRPPTFIKATCACANNALLAHAHISVRELWPFISCGSIRFVEVCWRWRWGYSFTLTVWNSSCGVYINMSLLQCMLCMSAS